MVISLPESPHVRIMARNPMLGLLLRRLSPKYVSMRFSPTIGTMSAAIDTATRSSIPSRSPMGSEFDMANACMSL